MKRICLLLALCLLTLSVTALAEEGKMKTVFFGSFPQQGGDAEPIEWIVLDEADGKMLLLAKDCLASLPWHNAHTAVTWDQSDLRVWLNGEFLQTAFTAEEQDRILSTDLDNSDVLGYGTPVGADTRDRIFLLSGTEGQTYLTDAIPVRHFPGGLHQWCGAVRLVAAFPGHDAHQPRLLRLSRFHRQPRP